MWVAIGGASVQSVVADVSLDGRQDIVTDRSAGSNSLAEELAFRGAMRTWLAPGLGIIGANLAQAVVFGLSHTGDDFVGLSAVIPTMLAMILVGYVGGVIARRTRSLTLPLALHAAADIPLYFYWACRVA